MYSTLKRLSAWVKKKKTSTIFYLDVQNKLGKFKIKDKKTCHIKLTKIKFKYY